MPITHIKSVTIPDATGTVTGWFGSSTVSVAATDIQRPSDWNSAHAVIYNLAGNTAGSSSISGTDVILAASGNITLSATNGSLLFSAGGGGAGVTLSSWAPWESGNNTSFLSGSNNSVFFQPLRPQADVVFSNIIFPVSISFVSSSNSQSVVQTIDYGLYSRQTGASSTRLSLMSSSRIAITVSYNSNLSAGYTMSQDAGSYTTSSAGTGFLTRMTGVKLFYMPFTATLSAGVEYAFGSRVSTSSAVGTGPMRMSFLHLTDFNNTLFGIVALTNLVGGQGSIRAGNEMGAYTAVSSTLPNSFANSQLIVPLFSRARALISFEAG